MVQASSPFPGVRSAGIALPQQPLLQEELKGRNRAGPQERPFLEGALLLLTPSSRRLFTNSVGRVSPSPLWGFRGPWSWVGRWSRVRLTVRGSWGGVFFWSLTMLPGGTEAQVVGCPPEELFVGVHPSPF